jgi:hypothetical protein
MISMTRLASIPSVLVLALAAFGCSAAPGTSSSGNSGNDGNGGAKATTGDAGTGGPGLSLPGLGTPPQGPSTPSGATPKAFCTALDAWLTKCGSTPAAGSEATCEQSYQKYSAAQIGASETCLAQTSCDTAALQQCLAQAVNGTSPGTPPAADAGAPAASACQTCVTAHCSGQLSGCEANTECVALYQCMQTAKTQQDVQACENQSPNGVTDLQNLLQCVTGPCGTVCK